MPIGQTIRHDYTSAANVARASAKLESQIARLNRPNSPLPLASGEIAHIGVDSEWSFDQTTGRNVIICYTAFVICGQQSSSFIYFTKGPTPAHRITLKKFIRLVMKDARKKDAIQTIPGRIYLYAHFLRADLPNFADFWPDFSSRVDSLRRTVTSLDSGQSVELAEQDSEARPYRGGLTTLRDAARRAWRVRLRFIDTLLLVPGQMALAEAGQLIGLEKLRLPDGYHPSQMDKFFSERRSEAEAYAMRDAEITVKLGVYLRSIAQDELGLPDLPPTISAMAVKVFLRDLKESGQDYYRIFGIEEVKTPYWHEKAGRFVYKKGRKPNAARRVFEQLANDSYHGGRNECFISGPTDIGLFFDFDLIGAYGTALVDICEPNYAAAQFATSISAFTGHTMGFAHIRFRFPLGTRYPSLPVRAAERGLYFPLTGETHCTAPEIEVAIGQGAQIEILTGVVIPWVNNEHRIFEAFVRFARAKRFENEAGSFKTKFYKELGNSLYGKLAQGLHEKSAYDTRTNKGKVSAPSRITNPYFAAHATGLVRAVVSEIMSRIPNDRKIISVTTDGFITDAPRDELDLGGPVSLRFQKLHQRISGGY